ncbi:unnamed protein product [Schistosoma mattheei]|uniref:Uncharacterized protein n=1 Tax=Schistosoma mattheei TaxID=31246 RepID=A0A183PL71_9TREM|nr:unnamed protein product [Schistosoma mattheei]
MFGLAPWFSNSRMNFSFSIDLLHATCNAVCPSRSCLLMSILLSSNRPKHFKCSSVGEIQ